MPINAHKSILSPSFISTNIPGLDQLLNGGLPKGSITEICGPPGVGKTQLCLFLCVQAFLSSYNATRNAGCNNVAASISTSLKTQPPLPAHTRIIYIDTEGAFSAERLQVLAQSILGAAESVTLGNCLACVYYFLLAKIRFE